jgi:hypothetical protein
LKDCLGSGNFDVIGGVPKPPVPAPAAELIVTRGKGGPGAILAIYATAEQAKAAAPAIKTNLDKASPKGSPGGIEQRGAVNVLWTPDPPVASTRGAVLACLPG